MLGAFDHRAVGFAVEQRLDLSGKMPARLVLRLTGAQELHQGLQLQHRLVIAGLRVVERHIGDEHDLLAEVVEGDDLVKEHEVDVLERLGVLHADPDGGLAVAEVVVGEIADEAAGEGRQIVKTRAFVVGEDLAQEGRRVVGPDADASGAELACGAGDLELRIEAEEGVAAPFFAFGDGFEHIAVRRHVFEDLHRLDGRADVRKDLAADRQHLILSGRGDLLYGFEIGQDLHAGSSFQKKGKNSFDASFCQRSFYIQKNTPDRTAFRTVKDE